MAKKEVKKRWVYAELATKVKILDPKVVKVDERLKQIYRIKN